MPLYTVVMAGGSGSRFWPKSRRTFPKQFLSPLGGPTLLELAGRRALALAPAERILVVTGAPYAPLVRQQLPWLLPQNLLIEPVSRETAAVVGLAAIEVRRRCPKAVMVVLPADHWISEPPDVAGFVATLQRAARLARHTGGLVTIGVRPTRAETGYGYLEIDEAWAESPSHSFCRVRRFVEKPAPALAVQYCASGHHYWNSGIFCWRVSAILAALARHLPDLHRGLERIAESLGTPDAPEVLAEEYPRLSRISIDYGVMERAQRVFMVPAAFAWDDVGSWSSLARITQADAQGNVVLGRAWLQGSRGCIVDGGTMLVAAVGVRDLVIAAHRDVVLVVPRERDQEVKAMLEDLERAGLGEYL